MSIIALKKESFARNLIWRTLILTVAVLMISTFVIEFGLDLIARERRWFG